jgi:transposase
VDAKNRTSGVKEPRYWGMPDALWERIQPLLPPRPSHPLGCHRPRVDDRRAMDAIFFVLRTGCQWNALRATGICSSSSAHRRFQEWTQAGVFEQLWALELQAYDDLQEIQWAYQAMDGALSKAPLGGGKNWAQSHGPRQTRDEAEYSRGRPWGSPGHRRRGSKQSGLSDAAGNVG